MAVHVPDDRATTLRLADVLGSAGFHQAGLQALLEDAMRSVDSDDVAELLRRTKSADQLSVLARLFLTDVGAPIAAAATALRPLPLADLVAAGFLTVDGERVRGCVRLRPVRLAGSDLIVASDRTAGGLSSEHVLGITGAGATLADITYRRRVARALDVGTGCGLQALGAAVHARDVVATDTNPRALAFTALNATLNDVVVETRLGDLLAPVSGEFDLIVSNPPFVISPESRYAYRDSGEPGDALCERLVRELPTRLASDGTAHLRLNWGVRAGESACDRPLSWLDGSVDALLLHREPEPVADNASRWLRQAPEGRSPGYPASYEHWLDSFAALGMDAICFGALALQKTPGRPGVTRGQLQGSGAGAGVGDRLEPPRAGRSAGRRGRRGRGRGARARRLRRTSDPATGAQG